MSVQPDIHFNGARILVVEDEDDTRDLVAFVLERHGATVIQATNVSVALEMCETQAPHIIVADIGMPDLNGYALITNLREKEAEKPERKKLPAIALTAFSFPADRERALAAGFDAYLTKPFDPGGLLGTIKRLLDENHINAA